MRYRRLGPTGLFVSELCFGTMTFGGKGFWEAIGSLGAADAESLVAASLDAGDMLDQQAIPIYPEETAGELEAHARSAKEGQT